VRLVDTHCHVNLYDEADLLRDEIANSGMTVHLVTTGPDEFLSCREWVADCPTILPCIGLIPQEIKVLAPQLDTFLRLADTTRYIGEVGLDYVTEDDAERQLQRDTFAAILRHAASAADKVISVHSRRAADDVIDMVGEGFPGTVILHWFSGSDKALKRALDRVWFSVNTAMIRSRRGKALIRQMDPARILTETDGPFVTDRAGTPACPRDVRYVIEFLAREWGREPEEAAEQVYANYLQAVRPLPGSA
jgi:TatD DNase family protein